MEPTESFDPRTWQAGEPAPVAAAETTGEGERTLLLPAGPAKPWVGLALSAAILVGGAVAAYGTRSEQPIPVVQSAG